MKRIMTFFLVAVLIVSTLSACSSNSDSNTKNMELNILSLQDYWDREIFEIFEQETGIKVNVDEAPSPETMNTRFETGAVKYDLFCSTDYMLERWIEDGRLLEIDFTNIPNISNIGESYLEDCQSFDPENKYTVPYFWGTLGILYDKTKVDEEAVKSWSVLWDEAYSGDIIMHDSMRFAFSVPLKLKGYSLNTLNTSEWEEARDLLIEQKPLIQSYLVDDSRVAMEGGNAAMAVIFSGEAYLAKEANENLVFTIPEEGSNIWIDTYCIPDTCQNKEAAEMFINFLCREDIAMMNFEYTYYSTPNVAVIESLDEELQNDTSIFPTEDMIKGCEVMKAFDEEMMSYITQLWKEVKGN